MKYFSYSVILKKSLEYLELRKCFRIYSNFQEFFSPFYWYLYLFTSVFVAALSLVLLQCVILISGFSLLCIIWYACHTCMDVQNVILWAHGNVFPSLSQWSREKLALALHVLRETTMHSFLKKATLCTVIEDPTRWWLILLFSLTKWFIRHV